MADGGILVYGEGPNELGPKANWGDALGANDLPALPRLIQRLLGVDPPPAMACASFSKVRHVHGGNLPRLAKKVMNAMRTARLRGYRATAVLMDRDGPDNTSRIRDLRAGRDDAPPEEALPCAVGVAVEAFDAWMIADASAIQSAGGDPGKAHHAPESLRGARTSGGHPKNKAKEAFAGVPGLGPCYSVVAATADLALLRLRCPEGFAPFAAEIDQHLKPYVAR